MKPFMKCLFDRQFFWFCLGGILLSLSACDATRIYDANHVVPGKWDRKDLIPFDVSIDDTMSRYNILLHVRNTGFYDYSELFLRIYSQSPDGVVKEDSLKISIADSLGRKLGEGVGDLRNHTVVFKRNFRFPVAGIYSYRIVHDHGNQKIKGIFDMGLTIKHAVE